MYSDEAPSNTRSQSSVSQITNNRRQLATESSLRPTIWASSKHRLTRSLHYSILGIELLTQPHKTVFGSRSLVSKKCVPIDSAVKAGLTWMEMGMWREKEIHKSCNSRKFKSATAVITHFGEKEEVKEFHVLKYTARPIHTHTPRYVLLKIHNKFSKNSPLASTINICC